MFKNSEKNTNHWLIHFQLILLLTASTIYLLKVQNTVESTLKNGITFIPLILSVIATIFMERKLAAISAEEAQIATREAMAGDMEKLTQATEEQNKNFLSHMEQISVYLDHGQIDELNNYLKHVSGKVTRFNNVLKISNPIISALLNSKLAEANARNIRMDISAGVPLDRLGEQSLSLARILGNLIDNAFDAVISDPHSDKYVAVKLTQTGPLLQVEVYNKGPVIGAGEINHIFTDGYTGKGEGHSGMGLHIVKSLTDQLAGTVKVTSDKTSGTRFMVVIPAK